MKFKFAALAGCSIATLLANAPAAAHEEIVVTGGVQNPDLQPIGLMPLYVEAITEAAAPSTNDATAPILISGNALAFAPLNLDEDAGDDSMTFSHLDAHVDALASGAPFDGTFGEPAPASVIDQTSPPHQRAMFDGQSSELSDHGGGGETSWLSEIRFGVLAHDRGPIVDDVESGADLNFEVLFNSPRVLSTIGAPRPHIGISAASDSDSTSYAYAGLTWEHDFQRDWFLVGGLGLAVHNGEYLRKSEQPLEDRRRSKALGCRVDFHWGVGVGRRLSREWNVAFHYEHVSSADVCIKGALGLESIGVRVGRVF